MSEKEDESREFEPTQKKLDDARRQGDVARSADLTTAAAYGGLMIASMVFGVTSMWGLAELLGSLLSGADEISSEIFSGGAHPVAGSVMIGLIGRLAPWFLLPASFAILAVIATRGFVIAPSKLQPRLTRISPLANAKNKFGRAGWFEFAKNATKLFVFSAILALFVVKQLPEILSTAAFAPEIVVITLLQDAQRFFAIAVLVALAIGGTDFLWQYFDFRRKNRMTRKEMTDESKQNEGDPMLKQIRRQRGYEIAMNRMLADVPDADVVVVNPTHYAVALKWSREPGSAPICVAKGVDEIARKIREVAMETGVPIHSDPPTARAIFALVEIGDEIRPEHYQAVAAAIRFAEAMRRKVRSRRRSTGLGAQE